MPITQSAKKALRQSKTRRIKNLQKTNAYKSALKSLEKMVKAGKTKEAQAMLPRVYKAADKAAKTGVIKKNKAARIKARASKLLATK